MFFYNRGKSYSEKGELEQAILDYSNALEIDPKKSKAYCERGYCWDELKNYEKAIIDYNKAIKIYPNDD